MRAFEPPAKSVRVRAVHDGVVPPDGSQVIDRGGQANQGGDAVVDGQRLETEPIEVDEREVEALLSRSSQDVSRVVVEMKNPVVMLEKGEACKLFQERFDVRAEGITPVQKTRQVDVGRPVAADVVALS